MSKNEYLNNLLETWKKNLNSREKKIIEDRIELNKKMNQNIKNLKILRMKLMKK